MGRRDDDERPPIEILGADPGVSSTQQVALGPHRPRRTRGWLLAVPALALAAVIGGVALGGADEDDQPERVADDEPRDNADHVELGGRQLTTTTTEPTTTTTPPPVGPVFGQPVEGALLLYRTGQTWTRVDLATGASDEMTLPSADSYSAVAMPGGLVIPGPPGEVWYYPVLGDDREPDGVLLGAGDQALRAGSERVWLFDQPSSSDDLSTHARLVDLRGRVLRELEVPGFQSYATSDELLLTRGGRVYAYDGSDYRPIAIGWVNGVVGGDALITACDDVAECSLRLQPLDGGLSRSLMRLDDPDSTYFDPPAVAVDGRMAIMSHANMTAEQRLLLFGRDGAPLDEVEVSSGMEGGPPQWLPGDLGLLVSTPSSGLQRIRPAGGDWVVDDLDDDRIGFPRAFFVVTP